MATIDYSSVQTPAIPASQADWEPPVHKYFGPKLPNGRMAPEPLYSYKPFPAFRYRKNGEQIEARLVTSEHELRSMGDGWADSPAEFGFVGAPTFDEEREMKRKQAEAAMAEAVEMDAAPRRGRPPKA